MSAIAIRGSTPAVAYGQPVGYGVQVSVGPCALLTLSKQPANRQVLITNRLFGVYCDEVENQRQRLVFPDHARDELLVAFDRILDSGDVLAGFIEIRGTRRRDPLSRRGRRYRKVED